MQHLDFSKTRNGHFNLWPWIMWLNIAALVSPLLMGTSLVWIPKYIWISLIVYWVFIHVPIVVLKTDGRYWDDYDWWALTGPPTARKGKDSSRS